MAQDPVSLRHVFASAPAMAQKLFAVIVRQIDDGPIRFKAEGVATPPEILEACGIDVGDFYNLLDWMVDQGIVTVAGDYPFEEIRLTPAAAAEFRTAAL